MTNENKLTDFRLYSYFVILLVLSFGCSGSQMRMVSKYTKYSESYIFLNTTSVEVAHFDENGNKIFIEYDYNGDGDFEASFVGEYDDSGNIILGKSYAGEEIYLAVVYEYNEHQDLISLDSEYIYQSDNLKYMAIPSSGYDGQDENILAENLNYRATYEYDEDGNLIHEIFYRKLDGEISYENTYEYDEDGNQIQQMDYNKDDVVDATIIREFDQHHHLVEYKYESLSSENSCESLAGSGLIVLEAVRAYSISFKYDEHDNIISETKTYKPNPDCPGSQLTVPVTTNHVYVYEYF